MEQLQSHKWLTASSYMGKYLRISSYIRMPFLIYDFATTPLWISLHRRKLLFSFLSVYWPEQLLHCYQKLNHKNMPTKTGELMVGEGKWDLFSYALSILLLSGEKVRPRQSTGGPDFLCGPWRHWFKVNFPWRESAHTPHSQKKVSKKDLISAEFLTDKQDKLWTVRNFKD